MSDLIKPAQLKTIFEEELYGNIVPFWEKNSPDLRHGGYYNCLDRDGSVYDTTKYVWLQARQVWMFSKLYNYSDQNEEWLKIADSGVQFLRKHAIQGNGRIYFSLDKRGEPIWIQRKIFSECFFTIALAEYGKASGQVKYINEAHSLFEKAWNWSKDLTRVGRPVFPGRESIQTLSIPMILLNVIEELTGGESKRYSVEIDECIQKMMLHVKPQEKLVLENIDKNGSIVDSAEGRLLNPGHAIEAGWFLHHWAEHLKDESLRNHAVNIIRWSFDRGWDQQYGGIYTFLDSGGYSPTQPEWFMKFWWPHTEAMYACLLNYSVTGDTDDLNAFIKVKDYTFTHFHDDRYDGWFGYLNREGEVTHRFKGGPYKGFFHIPRSLWLCLQLINKMENGLTTGKFKNDTF